MATQKLEALTSFLDTQEFVTKNQFDSWMEDGELSPRNKYLGADQLQIAQLKYNAYLSFEDFTKDPALLFALVCAWLIDNDAERDDHDLPKPDIDVTKLDNGRFDVEIKIAFVVDIELVQADNGAVSLDGQTWDIAPATIFDVTKAAVGDDQTAPTDLPYNHGDPIA
jgi:hypothetical protein